MDQKKASTLTDPNTRTGMSIPGNGNLRVLVPTHTPMSLFGFLTQEPH